MEENKKISESNSIYRMVTDSLLDDISEFKETQKDNNLNEKTFLNIFSIIKLFEEKEKEEKQKDLNCLILLNSNQKTMTMTDEKGNDDLHNKPIDSIWGDDASIIIRDNNAMLFENESKIVEPCDFNMTNQSNIFGDAFNGTGNNNADSNMNKYNITNTNVDGKGGGDNNKEEDDDYLVFKKEDLIVTKTVKSKNKQQNDNSNDASKEKRLEVNHSALSDANSNFINNKSSDSKSKSNDSNSNSNINSNLKAKRLIQSQSQSITKTEISIDTLPEIKAKQVTNKSHDIIKVLRQEDHMKKQRVHPYLNTSNNLSQETTHYYIDNMNENYLYFMDILYTSLKTKNKRSPAFSNDIDQLLFINSFKSFILSIGMTQKNFYEDCVRILVYQRNNFSFESFLSCFKQILEYKQKESCAKYQFLFRLVNIHNEDYSLEDIAEFFGLAKCAFVYEEIADVIENGFVNRYNSFYKGGGNHRKFNVKKLSLILETFFVN